MQMSHVAWSVCLCVGLYLMSPSVVFINWLSLREYDKQTHLDVNSLTCHIVKRPSNDIDVNRQNTQSKNHSTDVCKLITDH